MSQVLFDPLRGTTSVADLGKELAGVGGGWGVPRILGKKTRNHRRKKSWLGKQSKTFPHQLGSRSGSATALETELLVG